MLDSKIFFINRVETVEMVLHLTKPEESNEAPEAPEAPLSGIREEIVDLGNINDLIVQYLIQKPDTE